MLYCLVYHFFDGGWNEIETPDDVVAGYL